MMVFVEANRRMKGHVAALSSIPVSVEHCTRIGTEMTYSRIYVFQPVALV